ncbi:MULTISPECIES: hypothetical protein [Ralstonia solanacearum species complex]|uniref:Transmembrane protein n=2 Tax=Ralstonia solanacearum TaxID=305 RepID=A0AB33V9A6_RALSU|nr:hypothetical protein [Ralstonia solanacearum]ALF88891.1 hypothetical protein RSUY_25690 [Ralstonia solanacearum]ATI28312.1 hypothetical protein CCY86_12850 [Ralstonia solanacearum]EAP71440.1 Hypothetical Protein RRSL_01475 [Ralstonia solanacearum UW551]KEI31738.1 hypothetical protein CQ06_21075 [Ralstonia solanacearum]KFX78329.1 transmembrane protein [Ralstonia solanacearum]
MRLPASTTVHSPQPAEMSKPAEPAVDPADSPAADALPESRWRRAARRWFGGAFLSVASVLIAVSSAGYIGMAHAPWLDRLVTQTPSAAKDAANVAATAVSPSAVGAPDSVPDSASAARDRMDARVYSQVPPASARTVAQTDAADEVPAPERAAPSHRHHRSAIRIRHGRQADPWGSHWYAGG